MTETVIESGFAKVEAGTWLAGRAQPAACLGTAVMSGLRGFVVPDRGWVRKVEVSDGRGATALPLHDTFGGRGATALPSHDTSDGRGATALPLHDTSDGRGATALPSHDTSDGRGATALPLHDTSGGRGATALPSHGVPNGRAVAPRPPLAWFASAGAPFLTRIDALPDDPLHLVSSKLLVAPFAARVGAMALKLIPLSFQRSTPVTAFKTGWAVAATRSRVTRVALEDGETLTVRPEALVAWTGPKPTGFCPKLSVWDMILPRAPKNLAFTFHGAAVVWFEGSGSAATGREGRAPSRPFGGRFA